MFKHEPKILTLHRYDQLVISPEEFYDKHPSFANSYSLSEWSSTMLPLEQRQGAIVFDGWDFSVFSAVNGKNYT